MSYMTISSQEKHNFSLGSCFHAHSTTLLLKILGGPMHGRSPPPQIFWGARPPSPPRSPPLFAPIPNTLVLVLYCIIWYTYRWPLVLLCPLLVSQLSIDLKADH